MLRLIAILVCCFSSLYAVPIGSNLNRTPNVNYGCGIFPGVGAFGERLYFPTSQSTCTYLSIVASQNESPQGLSPGGILTSVRVRVGSVTGPMRATILRATRSFLGFQCCYHAAESPVFVPAPNSITEIPVRLPMRNDFDINFGETVDYLGLSVLAPGVPIPMQELGNPGDFPLQGAYAFFPFVSLGQERADGSGIGGVVPLIAGEFSPLCFGVAARRGGISARGVAAANGCINALTATRGTINLLSSGIRAALECNLGIPCVGSVVFASSKRGGVRIGTARINIQAGASQLVKVKLTQAGKRFTSKTVWMNAVLSGLGGSTFKVSGKVKLKR